MIIEIYDGKTAETIEVATVHVLNGPRSCRVFYTLEGSPERLEVPERRYVTVDGRVHRTAW